MVYIVKQIRLLNISSWREMWHLPKNTEWCCQCPFNKILQIPRIPSISVGLKHFLILIVVSLEALDYVTKVAWTDLTLGA